MSLAPCSLMNHNFPYHTTTQHHHYDLQWRQQTSSLSSTTATQNCTTNATVDFASGPLAVLTRLIGQTSNQNGNNQNIRNIDIHQGENPPTLESLPALVHPTQDNKQLFHDYHNYQNSMYHGDRKSSGSSNKNRSRQSDPGLELTIIIDNQKIPITENSLAQLKVPVIKTIAQSLGLKQTGKKCLLIERIIQYAGSPDGRHFLATSGLNMDFNESTRGRRRGPSSSLLSSYSAQQVTPHSLPLRSPLESPSIDIRGDGSFFPFNPSNLATLQSVRNCLCLGAPKAWPGRTITCEECGIKLHEKCMRWNSRMAEECGISFMCPICRMRIMDPFFPVEALLWSTYLHSGLPNVAVIETLEGESSIVINSKTYINTDALHQWRRLGKEVVVRCVVLGTPGTKQTQLQHEWPRTMDIRVNENTESIFPPRPDHKRRDVPSIITHFLRPERNQIEVVSSSLTDDKGDTPAFLFGIFLCNSLDAKQLMERVQEDAATETFETAKDRVRQLMSFTDDDDVACVEKSQKLKLTCPVTLTRIGMPARGRYCRHLQCFDLESFIQVTKGSKAFNNRWKCPECPLLLRDTLVVDQYVQHILNSAPEDIDVVEISPDGSYSLIKSSTVLTGEKDDSSDEEDFTQVVKQEPLAATSATHGGSCVCVSSNPWGITAPIEVEDIDTDSDEGPRHNTPHSTKNTSVPRIQSGNLDVRHENALQRNNPATNVVNISSSTSSTSEDLTGRHKRRRISADSTVDHNHRLFRECSASQESELAKPSNIFQRDGPIDLIDLSPSTCSSTAATEPEDIITHPSETVSEENQRKRRRGSSSQRSTTNGCNDQNRKGRGPDDDHDNDSHYNSHSSGCKRYQNNSQHTFSRSKSRSCNGNSDHQGKTGTYQNDCCQKYVHESQEMDWKTQNFADFDGKTFSWQESQNSRQHLVENLPKESQVSCIRDQTSHSTDTSSIPSLKVMRSAGDHAESSSISSKTSLTKFADFANLQELPFEELPFKKLPKSIDEKCYSLAFNPLNSTDQVLGEASADWKELLDFVLSSTSSTHTPTPPIICSSSTYSDSISYDVNKPADVEWSKEGATLASAYPSPHFAGFEEPKSTPSVMTSMAISFPPLSNDSFVNQELLHGKTTEAYSASSFSDSKSATSVPPLTKVNNIQYLPLNQHPHSVVPSSESREVRQCASRFRLSNVRSVSPRSKSMTSFTKPASCSSRFERLPSPPRPPRDLRTTDNGLRTFFTPPSSPNYASVQEFSSPQPIECNDARGVLSTSDVVQLSGLAVQQQQRLQYIPVSGPSKTSNPSKYTPLQQPVDSERQLERGYSVSRPGDISLVEEGMLEAATSILNLLKTTEKGSGSLSHSAVNKSATYDDTSLASPPQKNLQLRAQTVPSVYVRLSTSSSTTPEKPNKVALSSSFCTHSDEKRPRKRLKEGEWQPISLPPSPNAIPDDSALQSCDHNDTTSTSCDFSVDLLRESTNKTRFMAAG